MKERLTQLADRLFRHPLSRFKEAVSQQKKPTFLHHKVSRFVFFTPDGMWARKTLDLWGDTRFDTLVKQDTENKAHLKNVITKVSVIGASIGTALFMYGASNQKLVETIAGGTSAALCSTFGIMLRKRIGEHIEKNQWALDAMGDTYLLAKAHDVFVPMTVTLQTTMRPLGNLTLKEKLKDVDLSIRPTMPDDRPETYEMLWEEKKTRFGGKRLTLLANQSKITPENLDLTLFSKNF